MKYGTGYVTRELGYSYYKEKNFTSFVKELIHKNITFDSDVKVKESGVCSFMLHF